MEDDDMQRLKHACILAILETEVKYRVYSNNLPEIK
jgi:hypothetical protein